MSTYTGPERRKTRRWRWRLLTVWVIAFTALTFWSIRQGRQSINQLNQDKASISALQRTNCGLRGFLLTAEHARIQTAKGETGQKRADDLRAARGYARLAKNFTKDNC